MKLRFCVPVIFSAVLFAQPTPPGRTPAINELKAYLGLSDDQVSQLQQLRQSQMQSLHSVHDQIRTKHEALQQALNGASPSAAAVGQLLLDIQALRQQVRQAGQTLNTQALALLSADQKAKLQTLSDAQKLEPDVRQAVGIGLLLPPQGEEFPGMFGMGHGSGMMGHGSGMMGPGAGMMGLMGRAGRFRR